LIESGGKTLWKAEPDDWRAVRNEQGIIRQPIRFQGQYHDEESGLYYNRWRFYDPLQGRYITQDPIGLRGGLNNFAYTRNPVEWVDPLGLEGRACGIKPNDPLAKEHCFPTGEYSDSPLRSGSGKSATPSDDSSSGNPAVRFRAGGTIGSIEGRATTPGKDGVEQHSAGGAFLDGGFGAECDPEKEIDVGLGSFTKSVSRSLSDFVGKVGEFFGIEGEVTLIDADVGICVDTKKTKETVEKIWKDPGNASKVLRGTAGETIKQVADDFEDTFTKGGMVGQARTSLNPANIEQRTDDAINNATKWKGDQGKQ
jgi:RHS repeat-associated protein